MTFISKLHRSLFMLAVYALAASMFPRLAHANLCDRAFLEALRDRVEAPANGDVLEYFKAQSCEAFRHGGSLALSAAFFDVFGLDAISSSEQVNDFCLKTKINVDMAGLRRGFSSGLPLNAIHLLSSCAADGMQATIESMTDDIARIRVTFIDYSRNGSDRLTIAKIAPAGACTMPDADAWVGARGIELVCNRGRDVADRGQDIAITLTGADGTTRSLVTHIPSDRFVRTKFTIHQFATGGLEYWRCVETGGEKPSLGEKPRESDIVCKEDFCEQRPRATWLFFCKAELGYANRISPGGSAVIKFAWQTKLEGSSLSCSIDGKLMGKASCADNRCRSLQLQKAVCYQEFAPPETLPPEQ
jgi:hypothetical protein